MKKSLRETLLKLSMMILLMMAVSSPAKAQNDESDEPIITFKTNVYANVGSENQISLVLGTIDEGNIIEVDTGFGREQYEVNPAVYNDLEGRIVGTYIPCTVSSQGIVKIYGDPEKIDYLDASGCYIESIDFPKLVNLDILEMSHNELKSLDLSTQTKLRAIYLSDNTFAKQTPLVIGYKPELTILEVSIIDWFDPQFNLSDYPEMMSFDAYHCVSLSQIDPSGCPKLNRLTLDVTNVETVDVSKNPELLILNVSDTKVTSVDISENKKLREFYCSHRGAYNNEYKFTSLDLTNNPDLIYLVCSGNKLTELDVTKNPKLQYLEVSDNYLTEIDLSNNNDLYQVYLNLNCMDFATLPVNPGTWNTYYYKQRPMVCDKSYPVSHELDLSSRVLRDDTTTEVELYTLPESDASGEPIKLDKSYYTYNNGKITLNKTYTDSVYFSFSNSLLNENELQTQRFMIKSQSEYGLPTKVFNAAVAAEPNSEIAFSVGVDGASQENPIEFLVNFGDGQKEKFVAYSSTLPIEPNVVGTKKDYGQIEIYAPEGVTITALEIKDMMMYSADVTKLPCLRQLNFINTGLYYLDLDWNRCLTSLDLSYNNFSSINLESKYAGYGKNVLSDVNISNNKLTEITFNDMRILRNINLSNNQLTEAINLFNADHVETMDLSNNQFETLDFTYCEKLTWLNVSHNKLTSVLLPQTFVLDYFACDNNSFTLATLPGYGPLTDENYIYAPQAEFEIATKGPGVDLRSQDVSINGENTVFVWKKENGELLVEDTDYKVIDGITSFLKDDLGNVYCEMTHNALPQFTGDKVYKTTLMEVAGMPTNEIASFVTVNDGDVVELSLAAAKSGTALYIDWNGNNTVTQYLLEDTYKIFTATTKAKTNVKVYTYDEADAITVFSMTGAKLSSFDGSKLTDAINITVCGGGLKEIALPKGSTKLEEITLEGNNLKNFDASEFPSLRILALPSNRLTSIDVSENADLEVLSLAYNTLSSIVLDNDKLWALYLDNNNFTDIDLSGVPNLKQLSISNNYLKEINVENLSKLIMLVINNNYFTFETLPLNKSTYVRYYYYNQYPIEITPEDGVVDLSSQNQVDGVATIYQWYLGMPEVDEEGYLVGNLLVEDEDYTIEDGVTRFLKDYEGVMCVMMNENLPDVVIYTYLINVTADVEEISTSDELSVVSKDNNIIVKSETVGTPIAVYNMAGGLMRTAKVAEGETVIDNVEQGIYLVRVGKKAAKVIVR